MDALGKTIRFEIETHHIPARIGQLPEAAFEAKHEEHPRVVAEGDTRIAALDPVEGGSAQHGALGHQRGRDATPSAGIPEIGAQRAENGNHRKGKRFV